jgi:hypothetical protein
MKNKKIEYPVIEVPASGKSCMDGGAWCFYFMYTKNHGNFILKGYMKEIKAYIKEKGYTHWFAHYVLFCEGKIRHSNWCFWKDSIGIFEPSNWNRKWTSKYQMREYSSPYPQEKKSTKPRLEFKRMPHRWISEFDKF